MKERVKTVLAYKKPALWMVAIALISCIFLAGCLGTSQATSDGNSIEAGNPAEQFLQMFYTTNYNGRFENNDMMSTEAVDAYYADFKSMVSDEVLASLQANRLPYKYDNLYQDDPMEIESLTYSPEESTYVVIIRNSTTRLSAAGNIEVDDNGVITKFTENTWSELE